jgi:PadR family transcriptional regulator PadR
MGKDNDFLPGTLDMLVLKALARGSMHGYGIAQHIERLSEGVFDVGEGSLYPALKKLLVNGWVTAAWGVSDNNRRARYYKLTAAGRKQLSKETARFDRLVGVIRRVMEEA